MYAVAAWPIPGLGHFLLGLRGRAIAFLGLVMFSAGMGCLLQGKLFVVVPGQPLSALGTLASMAMGVPYFVLRYLTGYEGDITSASYEYGGAFLLTAGLMNALVILDAWDIATGSRQ